MYEKVIEKYGVEHQSRQAMEEAAELIQAINKALRYPTPAARGRLIEEIVDVEIMLQQLKEIYTISPDELRIMRNYKNERLLNRVCQKES